MARVTGQHGYCIQCRVICFFSLMWFASCLIMPAIGSASSPNTLADSIISLPPGKQIQSLWLKLYPPDYKDTVSTISFLNELQQEFENRRRVDLAQQTWLIQLMYNAIYRHVFSDVGIAYLDRAMADAKQRGWPVQEAECLVYKGIAYYRRGKYGPAFEFIQKGYRALRDIGFNRCANIASHLSEVGQCYYEFGDYEGAIQFLKEALTVTASDSMLYSGQNHVIANTLALAYQQSGQLDSAIFYFKKSHDLAVAIGVEFWDDLANGNLGNVYYMQGRYDEAIPLMEKDFRTSDDYKEWGSAVNAALSLASMFLKRGEAEKAAPYLQYAQRHINYGNPRALVTYYKNLAEISRTRGDFDHAFQYIDSMHIYTDSVRRINDTRVINQAKLKVEVEHHANTIALLEATRSRQVIIRNALLAILGLFSIIAILLYNQQRMKRRKELELAAIEQQRASAELESAKRELLGFTNMLKEKNELIESFRSEIDLLHQSNEDDQLQRTAQMTQLLNATILTEEDWKEFRHLFEKVYPGFFVRLKDKMSDLTPADTRLLALTKLQLAPKEMAAMLGISYEAIKKSRQRLRKKINLPEEGTLDEVVEMI